MYLAWRLALQIVKITPFYLWEGNLCSQPSASLCGYSHGKEKHLSEVFSSPPLNFTFEPLTPWAFSQAERVESTGAQGGE